MPKRDASAAAVLGDILPQCQALQHRSAERRGSLQTVPSAEYVLKKLFFSLFDEIFRALPCFADEKVDGDDEIASYETVSLNTA